MTRKAWRMAGWALLALAAPLAGAQEGDGKPPLKVFLRAVEPVRGLLHCPMRRHPDMDLREIMRTAGPRAEVVEPRQLRIFLGGREKAFPQLVRPFAVHQLIEGVARRLPRSPQQPQSDQQAEDRIGADQSGELVQR